MLRYRSGVLEPTVLGHKAQDKAYCRQCPKQGGYPVVFLLVIMTQPDVIKQHIKQGHGQGGNQLADAEGGGKICGKKIIQNPGHQVKCVPSAEDKRRSAHQPPGFVSRFSQHDASACDREK